MFTSKKKGRDLIILILILFTALALRLYKLNNPISEWHSWRQSDTAAVARNLTKDFNLLLPKYDDLSNIQTGQYNPEGLRMVEFPLYNAMFALTYKIYPKITIEVYGRLISVFFSLILIAIIYQIAKTEINRTAAIASCSIFAVFPFFVYYSRAILPEMTAISLMFVGIFFLFLFATAKNKSIVNTFYFVLSLSFAIASVLTKPTTVFFALTLFFLFFKKYGLTIIKKPAPYVYFLLLFVPLILWRLWVAKFPVGIPANEWLLFSTNTPEGMQYIFFRPAFFRWIFQERILNLILGGYLSVFFITGILGKMKKTSPFILSIGLSSLIYLFTFQGGNVQHDYYQVLILPALALFSGIGISFFFHKQNVLRISVLVLPVTTAILVFSALVSLEKVRDYYQYNRDLVTIAKIIKDFTKPDDKIVTDTTGDTTLLYLSDRKGYPAVTDDLSVLSKQGISYFVTQKEDVAQEVKKIYSPVFQSDKVSIFKL